MQWGDWGRSGGRWRRSSEEVLKAIPVYGASPTDRPTDDEAPRLNLRRATAAGQERRRTLLRPSVLPFVRPSVLLPVRLSVCLSPFGSSVRHSLYPPILPFAYYFICPSISTILPTTHPSIRPSFPFFRYSGHLLSSLFFVPHSSKTSYSPIPFIPCIQFFSKGQSFISSFHLSFLNSFPNSLTVALYHFPSSGNPFPMRLSFPLQLSNLG